MTEPTAAMQGILDSKAWVRVYSLLTEAAQFRGLVTYGQVAELMGLPSAGSNMARKTGMVLGLIVERDLACGKPMLSAVAVSSTNRQPGPGFFGIAEVQGRINKDATSAQKRAFWEAERDRVYDEWRGYPRR